MAHVVTEPCLGCKHTTCVEVCPVDCFHEGDRMLYIDPYECIDCGACIPVCPTEAIFHEDDVPEKWQDYIRINAEEAPKLPVIVDRKKPLCEE